MSVSAIVFSVTFWLAEPSTHTLFNQHLTTLRSNLEQAGLEIDHLTLSQGNPELNPAANWQRLLDEKA